MQNKLYRMEMVWSIEGKKGVYTTTEPEPDDLIAKAKAMMEPAPEELPDEVPF